MRGAICKPSRLVMVTDTKVCVRDFILTFTQKVKLPYNKNTSQLMLLLKAIIIHSLNKNSNWPDLTTPDNALTITYADIFSTVTVDLTFTNKTLEKVAANPPFL